MSTRSRKTRIDAGTGSPSAIEVAEPESSGDETTESSEGAGPRSGEPCCRCGNDLSVIRIKVDGNTLLMESCDGCDARRWQLAGERIDLEEALREVGQHAGRRR